MNKTYDKRFDGRKFDEIRPMEAKVGVVPRANGSAMFRIGGTIAIAAVYGPKELYPAFMQDPTKGILRCDYNMFAFSGAGDRVKPGGNRRSKEISMVTEKALIPMLDLSAYSGAVVDVSIELIQTDAGTRCAGITAAALALADAGIPMKDLVTAVSVGKVEDKLIVDLNYEEDSYPEGVDLPVAMATRTGEITLLQMDGRLTKEELKKLLEMAKKACADIKEVQIKALKEKYSLGGK
ncbi:exosome complex exonuclease Rrp41 [Candidatus Woesearchaeota archaeon]|nr:MAG: exosome complex component RRP41 [archaeon GW2011_AR18]MBS3162013.1 exosome complex exonuclease Rrp41 [Candidatus Woesearchaeota archaeon]HIH25945.1 exosome complex exonuclease Rrp41 [Nanoarchaeota archaeon]